MKTDLNLGSDTMKVSELKNPHLAPLPSLTKQYSDLKFNLGQDCFHAIRPLKIHGDNSRNSSFAVRLPISWVLSGPLPSSLGLPCHCFKCTVEDNSLIEQDKNWYELESYGTYKSADLRSTSDKQALRTLESNISHDGTRYSVGIRWIDKDFKLPPLDKFGAYLKNFQRDIHVKKGLLFNDNKLIVPAALGSPFLSLLHETHPGQFGMKFFAENICWPHLCREIYHHGKNCIQCIMAGKNLKMLLGTNNTEKLPILTELNEEFDIDFAGPLDKSWGNSKYLLLCINRFSKFPSAKVVNNTAASSILTFKTDYCHLHGLPKSIRADHGSCFTSFDFRNFCEKKNIKLILCTVGDHRSNGVVERLIYTVKAKLLAMSFNDPKPSLNTAIDKIIWNIRSTKQSSIGCSPFSKHFNRSPNTFWKSFGLSCD